MKVTGAISEEVNENVTETSLSKAVGVSGKITVTITSIYKCNKTNWSKIQI